MVNMKKISMIALTILTLGVTSCDMDKMPYDAVPTEEALTTIVGFEEARAGIYSVYLGLTGGSYVLAPEVQADAFNAVADFSNKYGELHRWTFESTNSTVETIWANCYAAIGRANFFIDGVGKIDENPEIELTEIQKQQINVYEGEAYFTRAYCYFYLATLKVAVCSCKISFPLIYILLLLSGYLILPRLRCSYRSKHSGTASSGEI